MRLLLWYWGRRGAGGQLTLALAEALARRPDASLALSLSRQADLLAETTSGFVFAGDDFGDQWVLRVPVAGDAVSMTSEFESNS